MADNRELALVLKLVADQFQSELKKTSSAVGEFQKFISDWKVQLTAVSASLFEIAKATSTYGDELLKASQRTGIGVQALSGLQFAVGVSDLSMDQLTTTLKKLSVNMVEAAQQTGAGDVIFRRLGLSATDSTGQLRPVQDVLLDLAEAFSKSRDGASKAEVAVKLFGRSGLELIPFLNQGKAGISELMEVAQRLGLTLSQEDAVAAKKFHEEFKILEGMVRGMTFAVGKELIPVMTDLMKLLSASNAFAIFKQGLDFVRVTVDELTTSLKGLYAISQFAFGAGKDAMSFDQLLGRFKELNYERRQKAFEIDHPGVFTPSGGKDSRPDMGHGPDPTLIERLKAQHELLKKYKQDYLEILKAQFATERVIIETGVQAGQTLEVEAATQRMTLRGQEEEAVRLSLAEQLEAENKFYALRIALGFKDAQDRIKVEADHEKQLQDINQKIIINAVQTRTAILQGQNEIDQAKSQSTQRNLQLLFTGSNAIAADLKKERDDLIANEQAWVQYYKEIGGDAETLYGYKMDLLRAQLAEELKLTKRQAAELLLIWGGNNSNESVRAKEILSESSKNDLQKETARLNAMSQATKNLQETGQDFFGSWAKGMRDYANETGNGFNLATDMARRTARAMETSFKSFFFDAMSGKIQTLKDLFASLLDFTKTIMSQIAATMLTKQLSNAFAGGFGGFGGGGGSSEVSGMMAGFFPSRATGGVDNWGSGTLAVLHGVEATVPLPDGRSIPVTMRGQGGAGGVSVPITIQVINQVQGAGVEAQQGTGADGMQQIRIFVRKEMQSAMSDGTMDKSMSRYGSTPKPIGR